MKIIYAAWMVGAFSIAGCSQSDAGQQNSVSVDSPKQRAVMVTNAIKKGGTLCVDQRDMIKQQAFERSGNPYVPTPDSCEVASYQVPIEVIGNDQFGFVIVQAPGGRGLVQQKDIENVYTEQ